MMRVCTIGWLQEQGYPLLNIICEKVAVEGVTRFEDRFRLPVGISVNMTSFSAKLLTQVLLGQSLGEPPWS